MSTLTPSQATKVLEDILMLLASPPAQTAAAPVATDIALHLHHHHHHHHLYQPSATVPSLNRLVESILVLDNIDTLPFVEATLARIYNILFAALQQSSYSPEPHLNTSLMIVDMLISAGHIALCQTRKYQSMGTPFALGTGPSMVFEQLVGRVLEPMPRLVHMSYSIQYFTHDMKMKLLSSCELLLSSIAVSMLKAVEQYDGAAVEHLPDPILACARVFDETILQLHTSMMNEATVDHVSLVSSAFALLKLMNHLSAIPEMQHAKRLMMHVLFVKIHDLFVESQDDTSVLRGDRMPSTRCCTELNVSHLALNIKSDGTEMGSMDGSLERQEIRRLAISLIYLKVAAKGPALESQELLDAITSLVIMEPVLDYLHGSSWIQLTWLYTTASYSLGLQDPEPHVRHRIMEGLNTTLGSADSVAHTVLGRHIESIQLWLWKTATAEHQSRVSDLLLPNLLLDWITRCTPDMSITETRHFRSHELNAISRHIVSFSEALKALKTLFTEYLTAVTGQESTKKENTLPLFRLVCSTVKCCISSLQEPLPDVNPPSLVESQYQFLGRVLIDSLETLAKGSSTTEEVPRVLLNVVEVLLTRIESEYENPSVLDVWDKVPPISFRGIHSLRANATDLKDMPEKLYNTVRLLVVISKMEVMNKSTQTMFEEQPLMASTLWERIQEIMDEFTQHGPDTSTSNLEELPRGYGLKFLAVGMLLILVGHVSGATAMGWFGLNDLALMSYYAIELCKRTRSREVSQSVGYAISAKLSLSVLKQVAHRIQDYAVGNRTGDSTDRELWDQVGVQVECMLDVIRQDLVVTEDSCVVWKTLDALRATMNDLTTLVSANGVARPTRPPEAPLDLFLWARSKLIHPENSVLLGSLVHRWMEEATRLKKIEEEMMQHSSQVHPPILRSDCRQLDRAGHDILSVARMIFLMTSYDPRSMPPDPSMPVVVQWLLEFLQEPVVSTFYNLFQSLDRNSI
ncbi:hypothetical protein BGZ82_004124 [Podila clonocystis]|nr:hypothetical protein BGZ82_004124 [Podila clonocystis]